jgi:hypothetical protein
MTYKELQSALKQLKSDELTTIALNSSKEKLQEEYDRLTAVKETETINELINITEEEDEEEETNETQTEFIGKLQDILLEDFGDYFTSEEIENNFYNCDSLDSFMEGLERILDEKEIECDEDTGDIIIKYIKDHSDEGDPLDHLIEKAKRLGYKLDWINHYSLANIAFCYDLLDRIYDLLHYENEDIADLYLESK